LTADSAGGWSGVAVRDTLLATFDYVSQRLRARLDGLSDAEYFWQPVEDCMTIRPTDSGMMPDSGHPPSDEMEPFTTIAWRLAHIAGPVLRGEGDWLTAREPVRYTQPAVSASAAGAIADYEKAYAHWRTSVIDLPLDVLSAALGPAFGPFADDSYAALILHVLDELIHHAAEIGVIRDLYAHTPNP
jgi:hypothetical protein